jgi:hypothetical protein
MAQTPPSEHRLNSSSVLTSLEGGGQGVHVLRIRWVSTIVFDEQSCREMMDKRVSNLEARLLRKHGPRRHADRQLDEGCCKCDECDAARVPPRGLARAVSWRVNQLTWKQDPGTMPTILWQ